MTHKVESNTHFSSPDNAWICYRQNQFKVVSFLKWYLLYCPSPPISSCLFFSFILFSFFSPQPQPSMSISDSGVLKEIHQLCVRLYSIKELSTLVVFILLSPSFLLPLYSLTETIGRRSAGGNSSRRKGKGEEGEAGDQHDSFCKW